MFFEHKPKQKLSFLVSFICSKTSPNISNSYNTILEQNQLNHLHLLTSKYLDSFLIIMLVCVGFFLKKKIGSLHVVRVDVGIEILMIACSL